MDTADLPSVGKTWCLKNTSWLIDGLFRSLVFVCRHFTLNYSGLLLWGSKFESYCSTRDVLTSGVVSRLSTSNMMMVTS